MKAFGSLLFVRLAFQNLLRAPSRTLMLLMAVALGTAAVFASFVVGRGIEASMNQSFSRMGADLIVVPEEAMVNITSALLTVQPTESTFDAGLVEEIRRLDGIAQAAPQTIHRVSVMSGMPECKVNLIAFDPARDFTVLPWLAERLPRPMKTGDLLVGCRRQESIGDEIEPAGAARSVYGKLGRSGVGPFDQSLFASYDTVAKLVPEKPVNGISAVLVRLAFGATAEQVRFAIGRFKGLKVIPGATIVTATRQSTTALLGGMLGFAALMLVGSLMLVGLIFSAIIDERRREIGLLRAIGARHFTVMSMLVAEAAFLTGLGGVTGILLGWALLLLFERSLVYYLTTIHVDFSWPATPEILMSALVCATLAAFLGLFGAMLPAWRAGRAEPYTLIQGGA